MASAAGGGGDGGMAGRLKLRVQGVINTEELLQQMELGSVRADDGGDVCTAATVSKLSTVQACTRYEKMRIDVIG